ncbi:MAG: hypothetical protein KDD22_05285, partial [Bdellovibrionales bacterium]|nr:hypothetical protein [Bdellovibrionales bacterium]
MGSIRTDINAVWTEMGSLRSEMGGLKTHMSSMQADLQKMVTLMEAQEDRNRFVLDAYTIIFKRQTSLEKKFHLERAKTQKTIKTP